MNECALNGTAPAGQSLARPSRVPAGASASPVSLAATEASKMQTDKDPSRTKSARAGIELPKRGQKHDQLCLSDDDYDLD